jgi:putative FmdB family regulatory protein
MALYEYDCPKCGTFEVTQRMSDPPLKKHDVCGSKVHRLISATSFQLKGGGWYSDGYASKKAAASSSSSDKTACSPSGCEKPGCATKAAAA